MNKRKRFSPSLEAATKAYRFVNKYNRIWADVKRNRAKGQKSENYGTVQHDSTLQYRRKRMPKGRRRRWVKFSNKVKYVIDKQQGTNTVVRNITGTSTGYSATINTVTWRGPQCWAACALYGAGGSTDGAGNTYGQDDLKQIFSTDNQQPMSKLRFKSAVLDITLSTRYENANTVPIELDVYHVRARGYGKLTDSGVSDLVTAMFDTYQVPNQNASADDRVTGLGRGETLFDVPGLLSTLEWTVLKKTKMFIPAGGQITYQIRDAKDHIIRGTPFKGNTDSTTMQYKGLTQFVVFVGKPIVGYSGTSGQPLFSLGCTRKYTYSTMNPNYSTTAIVPP